jgi:hypothetical protein
VEAGAEKHERKPEKRSNIANTVVNIDKRRRQINDRIETGSLGDEYYGARSARRDAY